MKPKYWDKADDNYTGGTLALQLDGQDRMYCKPVGGICEEYHQEWVNLIKVAPKLLSLLRDAQKVLFMHQGHSMEDVLDYVPHGLTTEIYTENVQEDIERLIYQLENNELED